MAKILVTGGTGYIGSHTTVELINAGFEVVIIDNLSNSYANVVDNIELITGTRPEFHEFDLTDHDKTVNFLKNNRDIAGIIHFAASKAVGESVENPLKYYHNNLVSLINILQGMELSGIRNLVFSSSCTVYGQPEKLPVTENSPLQKAWSPYGNTKQMSEDILFASSAKININSILLRYFNPIGAHESALIGELPIGIPGNLVPFITQTAIGKREVLNVFGSDYNTPDGTAIRDYIHVVDLAKAHIAALNRMLQNDMKSNPEVFNIGTGNGNSVLEVIHSFEKMSGVKLNYRLMPRRSGDVEKVWADNTLAVNILNWKAEKSLDEMMLSAWKWEQALNTETNT